jgi:hypothetical protein
MAITLATTKKYPTTQTKKQKIYTENQTKNRKRKKEKNKKAAPDKVSLFFIVLQGIPLRDSLMTACFYRTLLPLWEKIEIHPWIV